MVMQFSRLKSLPLKAIRTKRCIGTLVFADQMAGKLNPSTANCVSAAKEFEQKPIHAVVLGPGADVAAQSVARISGVDKVLYCNDAQYEHQLPEIVAPLLANLAKEYDQKAIVLIQNAIGKNISPRIAAELDIMQVSDVIAIKSPDTFVRPFYAGNALVTVKSSDNCKLLTVRPSSFVAAEESNESCEIQEISSLNIPELRTKWLKEELSKSERPDLGTAQRVVSGGRALKSKEKFEELLHPLADTLGAAIGASRAAVDSNFASNALQVGQTGQIVAPDLYIAVGISGAIQHLAGMKDSRVIAAINKDADAPIFEIADVGLIADLEDAVPELTKQLTQH